MRNISCQLQRAVVLILAIVGPGCGAGLFTPVNFLLPPPALTLNFFLHDNLLTLTNPSAFAVVAPVGFTTLNLLNFGNQSFFGAVVVMDDSITLGPDPLSLEIGRGKGFYIFDNNDKITHKPGIEFSWTAVFNDLTPFQGSTLSFKGFDLVVDPVREIAIVGGTGNFRLARGFAQITTYSSVGAAAILNITASIYFS